MNTSKQTLALATLLLSLPSLHTGAQEISVVADSMVLRIEPRQTQTEIKPGWKIVDIQLKSTRQRYLWGNTAKQYTHDRRPRFVVNTDSLLLSDMVLVRLKTKKEYRRIPKPMIQDNERMYVDFSSFVIDAYGEDCFLIRPIQPLEPGEYVFTWSTIPPVGPLGDWVVWPFCIKP